MPMSMAQCARQGGSPKNNMLTLKKLHILMLRQWLDVPLHGELLRDRNKFISTITPIHDEIHTYRKNLLTEMSEKNEKGEPILENGLYKVPDDKKEEFISQYNDLYLQETVEIEAPKNSLKDILMEKMTKGLGIEDGKVFEEIIECLE